MLHEFQLIERLKKKIPRKLQGRGSLGIGDDTAVLPAGGDKRWLLTTDALVDGVDFLIKKTPAELVGRKALAVNLSDVAAMGGKPVACVVTLGIPRSVNQQWIECFYKGLTHIAREYRTMVVGGDLSRSKEFFVSVALVGEARQSEIITRRGARPGDWIAVTGNLGGSILGRHLRFQPRVREGRYLAREIHPGAMIDISDGFVQDLEHVLVASKATAVIDLDDFPISNDARNMARQNWQKALRHALSDGEDFELLFTVSARKKKKLDEIWPNLFPDTKLTWVGRILRGAAGVVWRLGGDKLHQPPYRSKGYSHF